MTWQERAACADRSVNPDWFFPESGVANHGKPICTRCEVRDECLDFALREPVCGIWGGTTKSERIAMRREMGIKLPSGWLARQRLTLWEDRYYELRDLGYSDVQITDKLGVKPQSLYRQLQRYSIQASPELVTLATSRKRKCKQAAS